MSMTDHLLAKLLTWKSVQQAAKAKYIVVVVAGHGGLTGHIAVLPSLDLFLYLHERGHLALFYSPVGREMQSPLLRPLW